MNSSEFMKKLAKEAGCKLVEVPASRKATPESLRELEAEIQASIEENRTMSFNSIINAGKRV